MFGVNKKGGLPSAYLTDYDLWDDYMAGVWCSLFNHVALAKDATIIEVAPGSSLKIAKALKEYGFFGEYYLVEPYATFTKERYMTLLPDCRLYLIRHTLEDGLQKLPESADLLCANHPIDDMILAKAQQTDDTFTWTEAPGPKVQHETQHIWQQLQENPQRLAEACDDVFDEWKITIERLRPAHLIISQYASDALRQHDMEALNNVSKQLFTQLKATCGSEEQGIQAVLNNHENYGNRHVGCEVLDSQNWLVV